MQSLIIPLLVTILLTSQAYSQTKSPSPKKKEWDTWEQRTALIENAAKSVNGVSTNVTRPELGNHTPTLKITWDTEKIGISSKDFLETLRNGSPSIEVMPAGPSAISVTTWMLKSGQEKIVASRIKEVLKGALK